MAGTSGSVSFPPGPHVERQVGVTDAAGTVTFAWPAGAFTTPPVVTLALESASAFRSVRIADNSPTETNAAVLVSTGIEVLGISVLGIGTAAAGVEVHAVATEAGS